MLKRLRMLGRDLFNRRATEAELGEELRFHLDKQAELLVSRGMSPADARRHARLQLGGLDPTVEGHRDGRGTRGAEELVADVRYAARALWHDKPLAIAGVLTLALGIGATTAVFSAVNAVMLRELPYKDPSSLVALWEENKPRNWYKNVVAPANYLDWASRNTTFEGIAAYTDYGASLTLLGQGEPRIIVANYATGNFFDLLGVPMALGRGFQDGDTWDDGQRPAVLTHRLWTSQFNGDSSVIGKRYSLGGNSRWEVIGVLPESFTVPGVPTDIWLPTLFNRQNAAAVSFRRAHWLRTIGRLKPGVPVERANADLQGIVRQLQKEYPATNANMGGGITPLDDWVVGDTRRPLLILLAAAAVLLLIACANVGNLLLVHAAGRTREVSLRYVLGATRGRVVQQALTESLLLSTIGGLAGLAIGWAGARMLIGMQPANMLPITAIPLDYRVLAFTVLLTTISGVLFGLAPALIATRQSPAEALNAGGRSITGVSVRRWGRYLVAAEVALAVLLVVGGTLLTRSYRNVASVPAGFEPDGVLTARLSIPVARYDSAAKVFAFYNRLLADVASQPGVASVAGVRQLPTAGLSWSSSMAIRGRPVIPEGEDIVHREVHGDYFGLMRVPLIAGRHFQSSDALGAAPVAIINKTLADRYFPGEDPVGREIAFDRIPDSTSIWRRIVGVVGSEHQQDLTTPPKPEVFAPWEQDWNRAMSLVIRVDPGRDPMSAAGGLRRAVRDLDSLLALSAIEPMTRVHATAMSRQRFMSVLVLIFAATGVALAIVGIFGILAQLVLARSREMGLRIALGAQPGEVRWLVMRQGWRLLAAGIVVGLCVAIWATQAMRALLFGVGHLDLVSYATAAVVIAALGTLASAVPAVRASTADPAMTLRAD